MSDQQNTPTQDDLKTQCFGFVTALGSPQVAPIDAAWMGANAVLTAWASGGLDQAGRDLAWARIRKMLTPTPTPTPTK